MHAVRDAGEPGRDGVAAYGIAQGQALAASSRHCARSLLVQADAVWRAGISLDARNSFFQ